MSLDQASSAQDIVNAYRANSFYRFNKSVAQCQLFIHACMLMATAMPAATATQGTSTQFSPQIVEAQRIEAQIWLDAQCGGGVRYFGLENSRGNGGGRIWPDPGGSP